MNTPNWLFLACMLCITTSRAQPDTAGKDSGGETTAEPVPKSGKGPVDSYWKNDFVFSTPDENFLMKIRGNLHFDTKLFPSEQSANPFQFDVRRARMDFQGNLYKFVSFRVQAELADVPHLRNAWADFKLREWLHLQAGQMKPPFSTAWWTLDNNLQFIERGAGTPFHPYFDRGWWLWGGMFRDALFWNAAAFTGTGTDYDNAKGDIDGHKDVFGRVFASPFRNTNIVELSGLHLCLNASTGRQSVPTKRFETDGYRTAIRDDKLWSWETEAAGHGTIGSRDRLGAEAHYIYGPFSFSSEYLFVWYDNIRVTSRDSAVVIDKDGGMVSWSTWAGFFLTGESKTVGNFGWKQPSPARNFNPAEPSGPGLWEVLFRHTRTLTDEPLFQPVSRAGTSYRILRGAHRVDEFTAGLNWAWNAMVCWQLNYTWLICDNTYGGIRTGDTTLPKGVLYTDNDQMMGLRLILKY